MTSHSLYPQNLVMILQSLADILIVIVSILHFWFMILEMFLWTKPMGFKAFGTTIEYAQSTTKLAKNQGLYNGFLAVGLFWGIFTTDPAWSINIKLYFLLCVAIAGTYGALTVNRKIFFVQALPALIAILALVLPQISH